MRVNLRRTWAEFCLDCGAVNKRDVFRCPKCKSGNVQEHEAVTCPSELKVECRGKRMRTGDLPEHLAVYHPYEVAQFYCEQVARIYGRKERTVSQRIFTPQRVHNRRVRKLPGEP